MNPALIILVGIGAMLLWLLCSFLYRPIGRVAKRLVNDAKKAMFEETTNENEKETKE